MLNRIQVTTVFVKDQDAALTFYTDVLGMQKRLDMDMGDFRWIEVVPEGAETSITLSLPFPGMPPEAVGGQTGMIFDTSDIAATHETLSGKGVTFTQDPEQQPRGGISATFADPDGNEFMLVERTDS